MIADGDVDDSHCARCEAELRRLRIENDQLRRSASAFGELAERLNQALTIITRASVRRSPLDRRPSGAAKEALSRVDTLQDA